MNKIRKHIRTTTKALAFLIALSLLIIACDSGLDSGGGGGEGVYGGKGGSLARFAISNGHLYTVSENKLDIFNLSTPAKPNKTDWHYTDIWNVETIFPFGNYLFLGTQNGMYIFSTQSPSAPQQVSFYQHIVSCDPVVTDGTYAYVTLNTASNWCSRGSNVLQIVSIKDIANPKLTKEYTMVSPKGLGVSDSLLFVCDDGLKIYDKTKSPELTLLHHYSIPANDVIPFYGTLIVTADDGVHQYRYQGTDIQKLSSINY